ncbi:MAG TPA: T9SS type B sorting domain-containing protein [Flavobacterium sp.]|jgi:gliding motility-associated-like protein
MVKTILKTFRPRGNFKNTFSGTVFLFAVLFYSPVFAALPDFTLNLTKTDETCLGNGTLTFTVQGTDPAASVVYRVYQLPDLVNEIAVQTTNFLGGRTSGTYRVIATQSLGAESNSQTEEITISSAIVPLAYSIDGTNAFCGSDGSMQITITSGTGVSYEIISGPVTRPLQSSAVFDLLPAGVYQIRAFDNCGEGWVTTFTLLSDGVQIDISNPAFPDIQLPSCNTINAAHTLTPSPGDELSYPLTLSFMIHPPGGGNLPVTQVVASGGTLSHVVTTEIPFYHAQQYTYDLTVTDICGNIFMLNNNIVNQELDVILAPSPANCGEYYLMIDLRKYIPPYTVTFTSAPAGFIPSDFNPLHPDFSDPNISYGNPTTAVPFGTYSVSVTDSCGHTGTSNITLEEPDTEPTTMIIPYPGCQSDSAQVKIKIAGYTFVSAIVTVAPAAYPNSLPHDVSANITETDGLVLDFLPTGNYTVVLIDDCGNEYIVDFFVPITSGTNITTSSRADCDIDTGTVRIRGSFAKIVSAIMTAAPDGYPQSLPYDVSFNITSDTGIFSMDSLPAGNYTFDVIDICGFEHTVTVAITTYVVTTDTYSIIPHCGSFDLAIAHDANGVTESFWLQKFNTATGTWEHPDTGVAYIEGTLPDNTNSYELLNNVTNFNIAHTGNFRIIKRFESFANGNVGEYKNCVLTLHEFPFNDGFQITDVQKVTCSGTSADVAIFTNGVPPLTYKIISKNSLPFFIDNANENLFTGLEPAIYQFQVQHDCGHIVTVITDVAELPSLAQANQPADIILCDDSSNDGQEEFNLAMQTQVILGTQLPADYTVTYHLSSSEAAIGINPLPDVYLSGNAVIYARLTYNNSPDCIDTVSFNLVVNEYPVLQMQTNYVICESGTVTITADPGFLYDWSTGETTQSITVTQPGQYSLEVSNGNCTGIYTINVTPATTAVIQQIETMDWTSDDNSITVILDGSSTGDYLFSLDNVHFQQENTFENLPAGAYTVYVKNGCGIVEEEVFLLTYPKYFTPNGDGFHEYWKVIFSESEPHLKTYIFDRYGKLITGFMPDSPGWDGTLNGSELPSSDYWFVVVRENGKEFRGHFAMKR